MASLESNFALTLHILWEVCIEVFYRNIISTQLFFSTWIPPCNQHPGRKQTLTSTPEVPSLPSWSLSPSEETTTLSSKSIEGVHPLWILLKWNHVLFCVWLLLLSLGFVKSAYTVACGVFTHFLWYVTLHCMDIHNSQIHSTIDDICVVSRMGHPEHCSGFIPVNIVIRILN
jgi:hypothetical protein